MSGRKPRTASITQVTGARLGRAWSTIRAQTSLTYTDWLSLTGPVPDRIRVYPPDPVPPDSAQAAELRQGIFMLPGGKVTVPERQTPWSVKAPNELWDEALNGFGWLRHLNINPDRETSTHVRALISAWLAERGRWDPIAWQPHVTGRRLMSWFSNGRLILSGAEVVWRSRVLLSLQRQARHLARTAELAPEGQPRLTAAVALALSGLCLPAGKNRAIRGLRMVSAELKKQILPDGGHLTRNPAVILEILQDLLMLRAALIESRKSVPEPIQNAIDRMTPMVRFFRHGDGRFALFNGAIELGPQTIESVLARDDAKGQPLSHALHSGYHRIVAGKTLVLVDAGPAPGGPFGTEAHAGALSFEMSAGRHRLIVNCGSAVLRGPEWHHALRQTAAHSTLVLDDVSSASMISAATAPMAARLLGRRILDGPKEVVSYRTNEETGIWLESSHDGYAARYGLVHHRRFYLSPQGDDLRGEDRLEGQRDDAGRSAAKAARRVEGTSFAIRFHLHPEVRASLARDGSSVLLLLPNGDGWQFRASGGEIGLEESAYIGSGHTVRRSEQIVVSGAISGALPVLKWAIRRLSKTGEADAT